MVANWAGVKERRSPRIIDDEGHRLFAKAAAIPRSGAMIRRR